ncbi:hypothetical protein BO70DRAFT_149631 [Aspergillus heteromorphus CBS 117.55]|uniref:Uncharacterized protein n=1 Tax=Aspergillus heteromorphus CBS 117.55 TaxID=1448321 RepID=A0A317V488_9EURO|nr:uncharacterized protein BO70DRAFT_149631 [Aspergillus heteromorphus CBS 117.55]PWY69094.1 hypothetical protein BO70DRAFT_149631 [Aspergillus heteromorphus CBS 117.55]
MQPLRDLEVPALRRRWKRLCASASIMVQRGQRDGWRLKTRERSSDGEARMGSYIGRRVTTGLVSPHASRGKHARLQVYYTVSTGQCTNYASSWPSSYPLAASGWAIDAWVRPTSPRVLPSRTESRYKMPMPRLGALDTLIMRTLMPSQNYLVVR